MLFCLDERPVGHDRAFFAFGTDDFGGRLRHQPGVQNEGFACFEFVNEGADLRHDPFEGFWVGMSFGWLEDAEQIAVHLSLLRRLRRSMTGRSRYRRTPCSQIDSKSIRWREV